MDRADPIREYCSIKCFRNALESAPAETTEEGLSFAERLLKRRRVENAEVSFIDSRFLFPTSSVCERLFSKAGYALSDR